MTQPKLAIVNHKVICECDKAALYGECQHTAPEAVIAWLTKQVEDLQAELRISSKLMEAKDEAR